MTTQQLLGPFRKAIEDFSMLEEGDRIAVGVSGGKDSMTLLSLFKNFQRFSPKKFELAAITIDLGFSKEDVFLPVRDFCEKNDIMYYVVQTDIADIIFNQRKESSPCSLCSKMRRGALNSKLNELGFNKLALGHHSDDMVETFLLSLFFEGRLSTFAPASFMDRTNVTMIRPLIYIEEKDISAYAKNLPVVFNPCPMDKHTQREYMKKLIHDIGKDIPGAKQRMAGAISHTERYNLWDNLQQKLEKSKSEYNDKNLTKSNSPANNETN